MSGGLRDRALECTSGLFDDVEPEIRAAAMAEAFDDLPNEAVVEHGLTDPIYLQTISVQGFRGIGKNIDINLDPVPGVTVISARNGVGKSSVSEAVELVLTGQITRIDKPQADLGRSLQHADTKFPCLVTLTTNDGTTLEYKAKNPGAKVAASKVKTGTGSTLESVPWASALLRFRPFIGVAEHQAAGDNNGQTIMELLGDVVGDDLSSITARSKSLNERLRTLRRATWTGR